MPKATHWSPLCRSAHLRHPPCRDTAVVRAAVSDVPPRGPGVLPRRRAGGGGAACEGLGLIALLLELLIK